MVRIFRPGVFDLLHIGHINCIQHAASIGSEYVSKRHLIVGVHEDREVYKQKLKWPINKLQDRMAMLEQIKNVDEVISYQNTDISKLLKYLNIKILAVGADYGLLYEQRQVIEYCKQNNILIDYCPRTYGVSTTSILANKIKQDQEMDSSPKGFWNRRATHGLPTTLTSFKGDIEQINAETKREVDIIVRYLNPDSTILDLGCGDGRLCKPLAQHCKFIKAVDFSEDSIAKLSSDLKDKPEYSNITAECFDVKDMHNIDSDGMKYDVILMSGLLPCVDDDTMDKILCKSAGMLHNNGKLIIRTSLAKSKRFDLVRTYSEELNDLYTAYYRTKSEYERVMCTYFSTYKDHINLYENHEDTRVAMFIFEKEWFYGLKTGNSGLC